MKWTIIVDSGCDLRAIEASQNIDFCVVPLKIIIGSKEFTDNGDVSLESFQQMLDENNEKTSSACPGPGDWAKAMEQGDNIIAITISGAVSGSFNSAVIAKDIILESNPQKQIFIMNTLSGSGKMTLIVDKAIDLISQGLPFEDICSKLESYRKHAEIFFILQNVDNLISNGRLNSVIGKAISKLKLQLIATVNEKGELSVVGKTRDFNKSMTKCLEECLKKGYNGGKVIISHCLNPIGAEKMRDTFLKNFPRANVQIMSTSALCGYYAEKGGLTIGIETL